MTRTSVAQRFLPQALCLPVLLVGLQACEEVDRDRPLEHFLASATTPPPAIYPDMQSGGSAILMLEGSLQRIAEAWPSGTVIVRDLILTDERSDKRTIWATEATSQLVAGEVFPANEQLFFVAGWRPEDRSEFVLERWTIGRSLREHLSDEENREAPLVLERETVIEPPNALQLVLKSAGTPDGSAVLLLACDAETMTAESRTVRVVYRVDCESGDVERLTDNKKLPGLSGANSISTFEHEELGFTWGIHNPEQGTWILAPDPERDARDLTFESVPREEWEARGLIHGTTTYKIEREFFAAP